MRQQERIENHKEYLERIRFYKSFGYDIEQERQFIFEKSQPISGKILEVGTGKGYFTLELAKAGYIFTTIDISEEAQDLAKRNIAHARLSQNVVFKIEDAQQLSFPDFSFDVIFSINTIHHLENVFEVMDELMRILNTEGKIILSDFNKEGFKIMDQIHQSEGRIHEASCVSWDQIRDYLKKNTLRIDTYSSQFQDILIGYRQ